MGLWSHISATSSSSAAPSALSTTNVDRSMLHPSTVPPSPPSKLQPGHPIVLQPADAADAAGVGNDEPSPTTACFERWACARAPPAPAAPSPAPSAAPSSAQPAASAPPAQEAEIAADDDDEMGKWHIDRL